KSAEPIGEAANKQSRVFRRRRSRNEGLSRPDLELSTGVLSPQGGRARASKSFGVGRMNRLAAAVAASAVLVAVGGVGALHASARPYASPTPKARCGPGSRPETGVQGRVSNADVARGRAAKGYTCNADLVSHYGTSGGFKVFRYVDPVGHEC